MRTSVETAWSLLESPLAASSAAEASHRFHDAVAGLGATYLQTRLYRRPFGELTSATHWAAGGFVSRIAVPGWVGSAGFNYICFEQNPLLAAIRESRTRYRFSDFAAHGDRRFAAYWEALSEAAIGDALCATAYGADRRIASLHIGFDAREIGGSTAAAVEIAGMAVAEKLLTFADAGGASRRPAGLTRRERDCIAFVADGKTDWEIAAIMGVAEATARFHVDNARRKLGAVNRAHAVARFLADGGAP